MLVPAGTHPRKCQCTLRCPELPQVVPVGRYTTLSKPGSFVGVPCLHWNTTVRMGRCMQRPCAARPLESPSGLSAAATGMCGGRPPVESRTSAPPTPGRLRASTWRAPCPNRSTRRHLTQRRATMPPVGGGVSTRSLRSSGGRVLHPATQIGTT